MLNQCCHNMYLHIQKSMFLNQPVLELIFILTQWKWSPETVEIDTSDVFKSV